MLSRNLTEPFLDCGNLAIVGGSRLRGRAPNCGASECAFGCSYLMWPRLSFRGEQKRDEESTRHQRGTKDSPSHAARALSLPTTMTFAALLPSVTIYCRADYSRPIPSIEPKSQRVTTTAETSKKQRCCRDVIPQVGNGDPANGRTVTLHPGIRPCESQDRP